MTATCECNPSFNCESKNEQILKSFCQNYIDQGKNFRKNFMVRRTFELRTLPFFMFLAIEQEQSTRASLDWFSHPVAELC